MRSWASIPREGSLAITRCLGSRRMAPERTFRVRGVHAAQSAHRVAHVRASRGDQGCRRGEPAKLRRPARSVNGGSAGFRSRQPCPRGGRSVPARVGYHSPRAAPESDQVSPASGGRCAACGSHRGVASQESVSGPLRPAPQGTERRRARDAHHRARGPEARQGGNRPEIIPPRSADPRRAPSPAR